MSPAGITHGGHHLTCLRSQGISQSMSFQQASLPTQLGVKVYVTPAPIPAVLGSWSPQVSLKDGGGASGAECCSLLSSELKWATGPQDAMARLSLSSSSMCIHTHTLTHAHTRTHAHTQATFSVCLHLRNGSSIHLVLSPNRGILCESFLSIAFLAVHEQSAQAVTFIVN